MPTLESLMISTVPPLRETEVDIRVTGASGRTVRACDREIRSGATKEKSDLTHSGIDRNREGGQG